MYLYYENKIHSFSITEAGTANDCKTVGDIIQSSHYCELK
jgi:hypothetical protein